MLGTPSAAVVESGSITPKNNAPIEIEDNDGFAVTEILLDDGFNASFKCLYDSALTWPAVGDNVTLTLPKRGAKVCTLVAIGEDISRKREAMITLELTHRPGINT